MWMRLVVKAGLGGWSMIGWGFGSWLERSIPQRLSGRWVRGDLGPIQPPPATPLVPKAISWVIGPWNLHDRQGPFQKDHLGDV